jgi:hypothetical protein
VSASASPSSASSPSSSAPPPAPATDARPLARLWGAAAVVALAAAPWADRLAPALPACPLRAALGWPCPTCGSGRALLALAALDPLAALAWNPLAALAAVAFAAGGLAALGRSFAAAPLAEPRELPRAARWALAAAIAGNWLYLALAGR